MTDLDLIWIRHWGHVERDELRRVFGKLQNERQEMRFVSRVFTDLAEVTQIEFGFREIHWHAHRLQEQLCQQGVTQVDSLHAPGPVVFGLGRIYQQVVDSDGPLKVHVNERRDLALQALDLPVIPPELL